MPRTRKIRLRKRFQRAHFGMKRRGVANPKQRLAVLKRNQTRRTKGR